MPEAVCGGCGATLTADALVCSECRQLVHADELERLAREARDSEQRGAPAGALARWRQVLALLPADSAQARAIRDHAAGLEAQVARESEQAALHQRKGAWAKALGPIGIVLFFAFTKAKFLLLGLTKAKTLFSMLAFLGVYWSLWGWRFALGFVVGIYIHEMGHVWALRRFGLRASAPMFIPGFGAFVSLYDAPANAGQDSRIGLAGPMFGLGFGLTAAAPAALLGGSGIWLAIAHSTAILNLFNLIPVWQLDGGRGFRALDRGQRLLLLGLAVLLWLVLHQPLFLLILIGAAYRIFLRKDEAPQGDRGVLLQFTVLLVALGWISVLAPTSIGKL